MSSSMFATEEIKTLRITSYLKYVCNKAGIELTGYQLERYFEPEKVSRDEESKAIRRSCKYDRYIRQSVCPNQQTASLIETKAKGSTEILHSPIWHVLDCIKSERDLEHSILNLHPQIQIELFEAKRNAANQHVRKLLTSKSLENIMTSGDLHGVCGLLILLFGTDKALLKISKISIEKSLVEMLLNLATTTYPIELVWNIYQCVAPYLPQRAKSKTLTYPEFEFKVVQKNKLLTIAANEDYIMYIDEQYQFLTLMFHGNTQLIKRELNTSQNGQLNKGLKVRNLIWLLKKLNNTRTYADKRQFLI